MKVLLGLMMLFSLNAGATTVSPLTYDVGFSTGSYAGNSYSEMHLGLNWYFWEYFNWRNSAFTRSGKNVESATGLDSSLRFETRDDGADSIGYHIFAGPGFRFSSQSNSAYFAEAGSTLRLGGLSIGAGFKHLNYVRPGNDSTGAELPKGDTNVFLIIAGGGAL